MTQPLDHLAVLARLQDEFAARARGADLTAPVPWCGRWRVRHLVEHLARVHHWAAGQARRRQEVPLGRGPFDLPELYLTCAVELRQTLAELGPDADAWTLVGRGPASFWHRRQVHETLVHLWDLRAATALAADPALPRDGGRTAPHGLGAELADGVAPEVWADTVDEVVGVMHPRQVDLGRVPALDVLVHLVARDVDRSWTLAPDGDLAHDRDLAHGGDQGSAAVTVTGSAASLALLLWGRLGTEHPSVEVRGDRGALDAALAAGLTP